MRQQQTSRGFIFILLMLILIATAVRLPYARQADKITNQDSIQILDDGQASETATHQDPQAPTGEVVIAMASGQVKRLYVTDVKNTQKILDDHKMGYVVMDVPQENYLVTITLPLMLSIMVVVIIIIVMNRSAGGSGTSARMMNFDKNRARMSRDSRVNFSNVAGLVEGKEELEEIVDFLGNPQKYTSVGARIPRGLLLVGPSEAGKTLLTKATAGEAGVPFFSISGSDFVEMFVDVGASRIRDLFEEAKKNSPYIIFIGEVDAVAYHRGTSMDGGHDEKEQTLNQLLVEIDGFGVNEGIIVMAATNRADILDPAILRPGRFDREAAVDCPDVEGCEEILKVHSKDKPLSEDMDLRRITQTTTGFTDADLRNLMNEVAIVSARGSRRFIKQGDIDRTPVKMEIGVEKKSEVISEEGKKTTAYHETGHAILFHVLPNVGPVHTVSIIPTGIRAASYTMSLPERDEMFNAKGRTLQSIVVDLGERIAEELMFDDITTGASQDIRQVTRIAGAMMAQYGMSDKVGMIRYGGDDNEIFIGRDLAHIKSYGSGVADTINGEVKCIVSDCYQKTTNIIKRYDYVLHSCAALLTRKEEINQEEFETLFTPAQ